MAKKPQTRAPKKRRPAARARVLRWQDKFIATLRHSLNVTWSARVAGVGRRTVYQMRETDPEFAAAWDEALREAVETAEGELYRRAVQGTLKPVFQGGAMVGKVREFSDTLLIFLLKSHAPHRYRETLRHETWQDDVLRALPGMTPDARATLYAELRQLGLGDDAAALFARVGLPVTVRDDAG